MNEKEDKFKLNAKPKRSWSSDKEISDYLDKYQDRDPFDLHELDYKTNPIYDPNSDDDRILKIEIDIDF